MTTTTWRWRSPPPGVVKVNYARTWAPDPRVLDDYRRLQARLDAEHVPTEYEIVALDEP